MSKLTENELIKRLMRFVSRDAMNISGFSRTKFLALTKAGLLKSVPDIYRLDKYKYEIIELEIFDCYSFDALWHKIRERKTARFENFLYALNIPLVGLAEAQEISKHFDGDLVKFESAIMAPIFPFDFTTLEGFTEEVNNSIYEWFGTVVNTNQWCELKKIISFKHPEPSDVSKIRGIHGKRIVITGTLRGYTRYEGQSLITSCGGIAQERVTRDTDFLVIAASPGRKKIEDADKYGITKITESEFMSMIK